MAEAAAELKLPMTVGKLAAISEVTKRRERARIADEIDGHAAIEDSLGNAETAQKFRVLAESIRSEGAQQPPRKLTPEEALREGERLLVPGLERAPSTGFFAEGGDDGALPPMVEHDDEAQAVSLARNLR